MLNVIGIGYPRTGTMSLKHALEDLGFGPCYHMIEVFNRPDDVDFWLSALQDNDKEDNNATDWNVVFEKYQSTADCPACYFWRALLQQYPNAQYVLTVRDPDRWYESFRATVYQAIMHPERAPDEAHRNVQLMARQLILDTMFEGRFDDRSFAIDKYQQHNREIREFFPKNRLLVFEVSEGWSPLCEFLNVGVPDSDFPKANTRTEFQERFAVEAKP